MQLFKPILIGTLFLMICTTLPALAGPLSDIIRITKVGKVNGGFPPYVEPQLGGRKVDDYLCSEITEPLCAGMPTFDVHMFPWLYKGIGYAILTDPTFGVSDLITITIADDPLAFESYSVKITIQSGGAIAPPSGFTQVWGNYPTLSETPGAWQDVSEYLFHFSWPQPTLTGLPGPRILLDTDASKLPFRVWVISDTPTPPPPLPEPSTILLLGLGLVSLIGCGWRCGKG